MSPETVTPSVSDGNTDFNEVPFVDSLVVLVLAYVRFWRD